MCIVSRSEADEPYIDTGGWKTEVGHSQLANERIHMDITFPLPLERGGVKKGGTTDLVVVLDALYVSAADGEMRLIRSVYECCWIESECDVGV